VLGGFDNVPVNSQIHWQRRYKEIFLNYAQELVYAIWEKDEDLAGDRQMKQFYDELDGYLKRRNNNQGAGLPDRYKRFRSRDALSHFLADTMFVVILMHEVYGTYVPSWATDASLLPSEVPKDKPIPTIEDYASLIMVTAATSRVKFPLLLEQNAFDPFSKCNERFVQVLPQIFLRLQKRLRNLDSEWTATAEQLFINTQYGRVLPRDLEVGAGY